MFPNQDKDVAHPVASRFDINQQPDIQLIHMSQKSSTGMPKGRKIRGPKIGRPDVGLPPVKPEVGALASIEATYKGGRKPALVLNFRELPDGNFMCPLGEVRLEVHAVGRGVWKAFLTLKTVRWSRKRKDFTIRWRQLMSGQTVDSAHQAVHSLSQQDGWFLCEGYWRPLAWVYRSVITVGLEIQNGLPKSYERGLRAGHNLPHIKGFWKWERDSVPELIRPLITLPDNTGLSRTPELPDRRSEMGYDQDDKHGKPSYGTKFYDSLGRETYPGKIVKAPVPRKPSGKDVNPVPKPKRTSQAGIGIKKWMEQAPE